MRPSKWRIPVAVTASACILGTGLQADPALAHEYEDGLPTVIDVSPRAVATTDFITDNDAVTLTATGFLPGEKVRLDIASTPTGIEAIHDRKRARADGTVTFPIGGSPGRPTNTYAGGYQAEITSEQSMAEGYLSESFSVLPVIPADGTHAGTETGGATPPIGRIGPRANNGLHIPPGPGFSVIGVGLSLLALIFTSAATAVVARRSQKSTTHDRP
ncbi:hypothetical protein SAMN04489751_2697 [Brevibacterium sandarakinum]|uniref:Uncharacterized protein n=1 Tax=Brevibacterium sandarakinum TaxID=629680 RepID=A0A1H1UJ82_BRESA|nr:hypothetical protein [Brevibacterium sandarakinum]SDS72558.1 hypothetical protein SAMN04489751_2697 [Brevibacterium sandarakinum]